MAEISEARTHTAWAYRREGKRFGRVLEVGAGRLDEDGRRVHVFLDRLPIGGFTGYVLLAPIGEKPPVPEARPERPGESDGDDEDAED